MFNFDQTADIKARDLLYSYRKALDPIRLFEDIFRNLKFKKPLFFGAGPNLWSDLNNIHKFIKDNRQDYYLISADGASNALYELNLLPNAIFTDLDGLTPAQISLFSRQGSLLIVHSHGDNIDNLKENKILLKEEKNLIATTQTQPIFPVINPGGFTDGDRGLFFCHHLAPLHTPFILYGYDFGEFIGKYSKNTYDSKKPISDQKRKKLEVCKNLIEYLKNNCHRTISFY